MDRTRYRQSTHEAAWADWLRDDTFSTGVDAQPKIVEPAAKPAAPPPIAPSVAAPPTPTPTPTPVVKKAATIQIDIRVPRTAKQFAQMRDQAWQFLRLRAIPFAQTHRRNGVRFALAATVLAVAIIGGLQIAHRGGVGTGTTAGVAGTRSTSVPAGSRVVATEPSFTPVVPADKPELARVGTEATAYDGTRDSFSFTDTVSGTPITVSQQTIPTKFGSPEAALEKAAKAIGANSQIATKFGTAHIKTDVKSNSQIIVFMTPQTLVLIQSPFARSNDAWVTYIFNLQTPNS